MALLFQEPIKKYYTAAKFSVSYFVCSLFLLLAVILPFFLAFTTNNFWVRQTVYQEHPRVLDRKEVLVFAYSESGTVTAFTSVGELNELFYDNLGAIAVQSSS